MMPIEPARPESDDHKNLIRAEFTRQAKAYAANRSISDLGRLARLVGMVAPKPEARVLEVATGPGYVAMGFALACREVVGVDLTATPLEIAKRRRRERGLDNVCFRLADAENLPFEDASFDVVVCCLAFHHLEDPTVALREMVRVCRTNGTVEVEDLIASEHPERGAYHNRWENLRDPSHTRALPLSEHLRNFASVGLEVENVRIDTTRQDAEEWLERASTPSDRATQVRALIDRDAAEDLSGTSPGYVDGRLIFDHHIATIVGRRLSVVSSSDRTSPT